MTVAGSRLVSAVENACVFEEIGGEELSEQSKAAKKKLKVELELFPDALSRLLLEELPETGREEELVNRLS